MIKLIQVGSNIENVGQLDPAIASNLSISGKGNLTISSPKKLNFEPHNGNGDITFKPGDDIVFESHHREEGKQNEISMKFEDGNGNPVNAQLKARKYQLVNPDTTSDVVDLEIGTGTAKDRGYLKLRARAIDLRCEKHGGVAILPKGADSSGKENKIKFEHGGGDGLEFGTFNTKKSSLFTDEYRFNKNGVVKMATRETEVSDKFDGVDETTLYKYVKQSDDFYDKVTEPFYILTTVNPETSKESTTAVGDEQTTWNDIIKSSFALNTPTELYSDSTKPGFKFTTHVTDKGNLEIESQHTSYSWVETTEKTYAELKEKNKKVAATFAELPTASHDVFEEVWAVDEGQLVYKCVGQGGKNINIESEASLKIVANEKITIDAKEITLKGVRDFGSTMCFGETDEGIKFQHKLTKKGNFKACDVLQIEASAPVNASTTWTPNNTPSNEAAVAGTFIEESVALAAGEKRIVGQVSILDIIKFINWAKTNNFGPWE